MNKSTSKLKNLLNKYCFKRKFEQNSVSYLTSLAPKVITDEEGLKKISPYLETLKEAIDSGGRDITNIAITGTYGSGKSTVLKTFQYHNDNYKYLNISLASFKDIEEPTSNNDTTETKAKESLERRLEISILQQIFYRVKHSETPDSRFKRIINIPWWQLLITSLCVVLWIFALLSAIKFNYFESLNPITWSRNWSFDWIVFITFLIIVLGVVFLFYKLISVFVNSRINKVNIKGELELGSRIDKSVFNEYLEEIFYFFEKTKFNVVVIEDIDRFSTTEIFTKLRELNTLINNSDLIKRKVVFIYAIRDEVFKDKLERVKFFDFIIPIIPFINPTNANEQLTTLIDKKLLSNELSKNFTNDLVSFIDDIDMRLLINIFNEYLIYKGCLENSSLVQENLFAIITYKNLFPEDFGKLQKREGILYEFISRKPLYISEIINKIDKRINDKEEKIELIQNELDISIRELRSIYLMAFKSLFPNAISFYLDKEVSFNEMLNDDNFQKLQSLNEIKYVEYQLYDHYRYNKVTDKSSSKNFKSIEEYVNKNLTYSDRLKNLESKANNNIEILRKDIEKLKEEKREINSWDLKDILNQISIDEILECLPNTDNGVLRMDVDKVIFNNNIMRYVLWNGYINESYFDYITLFHEVNVTSKEFSFIRKVKVGVVSEFDVELNNIREVVKRIPSRYYQFESILNFNLVDFILEHSEEYHDELSSIMRLLSNEKDKSVEFIDKFIERNSDNVRIFIQKLCNKWTDFWNYIVEKSNYTEEKKNNYLKLIIECADLEDIENLNNSGKLSASIERESLFLNLFNKGDFEKLQSVVELFNIKFVEIEKPTENSSKIFQFVYDNNYYQINEENISLFLNVFDDLRNLESLDRSNYTIINNSKCNNLKKYIEKNIEKYVKNVFLKLPNNTSESKESIVILLNNDKLDVALKTNIILKQELLITDLYEISDYDVWKMLIEQNKIVVTWANLFIYYETLGEESDLDEILINFLNQEKNYNLLSKQKIKTELEGQSEEVIKSFSLKVIKCNDLHYESYVALMNSIPNAWDILNFEKLDRDKVEWMTNTVFLDLTESNFTKLKDNFPNLHIKIIEKQEDKLFKIWDDISLDENDILLLLKSTLNTVNKTEIIKRIDENYIIENVDIARYTCDILTESEFIKLSYSVLKSLMRGSSVLSNKIDVLNKQFGNLTDSQLQSLVELLGDNYPRIFIKQNKPKFIDTEYNRSLFDKLKERNLIIRYESINDNQLRVIANY